MKARNQKSKIYILPSLFTTVNLLAGFYAIIAVMDGKFMEASLAILVAGLFDCLDGRVARMTGTCSQFGVEYDSLCDLVSFGLAPALLAQQWALLPFGRFGWLAAFLYAATTALRLARFNTQDSDGCSKEFTGLPCPAAAFMVATTFMFCSFFAYSGALKDLGILMLIYILSYLMVSSIGYQSFKRPETLMAKTFQGLVAMVLLIMVLATEPQVTLFCMALIYLLSGPFGGLYRLFFKNGKQLADEKNSYTENLK